jgi:predicted nucleic acid-binding protein
MRPIDSDVIIWNWRGRESAATVLAAEPFAISAVTYMELVQGMRNPRELKSLRSDLKLWQAKILPIAEVISRRAATLVETHFLSHHLQLADALIAATALEHKLVLLTSNTKHFQAVKDLKLETFRAH